MTRKEKLYKEWLDLRYEIQSINGTAIPRTTPQSRTIAEWESFISSTIKFLRRLKEQQRVDEYWATEEGQARKKALEEEQMRIYYELEEWFEAGADGIHEMVWEHIGEDFDIRFGDSKIEIGLVEKYNDGEELRPCFYFGHSWDVYYGYDLLQKQFRFEMGSVGLGYFNLIEDKTRTRFIEGMAKFATDIAFLDQLKDELEYFDSSVRKLQKRIRAIDEELKNPFANK